MTPRIWTEDECKDELAYIKRINPRTPGTNFNHDPKCFVTYVNGQAQTFHKADHPDMAQTAQDHIKKLIPLAQAPHRASA